MMATAVWFPTSIPDPMHPCWKVEAMHRIDAKLKDLDGKLAGKEAGSSASYVVTRSSWT